MPLGDGSGWDYIDSFPVPGVQPWWDPRVIIVTETEPPPPSPPPNPDLEVAPEGGVVVGPDPGPATHPSVPPPDVYDPASPPVPQTPTPPSFPVPQSLQREMRSEPDNLEWEYHDDGTILVGPEDGEDFVWGFWPPEPPDYPGGWEVLDPGDYPMNFMPRDARKWPAPEGFVPPAVIPPIIREVLRRGTPLIVKRVARGRKREVGPPRNQRRRAEILLEEMLRNRRPGPAMPEDVAPYPLPRVPFPYPEVVPVPVPMPAPLPVPERTAPSEMPFPAPDIALPPMPGPVPVPVPQPQPRPSRVRRGPGVSPVPRWARWLGVALPAVFSRGDPWTAPSLLPHWTTPTPTPLPSAMPLPEPAPQPSPPTVTQPLPQPIPISSMPGSVPNPSLMPLTSFEGAQLPFTRGRRSDDECECEDPERREPNPSNVVARVRQFARRMSQNSLDNLQRGFDR